MNDEIKNLESPTLAYAFDALEPHIDALTMEIHFTRHHQAYFNNLQNAVKENEIGTMPFGSVLKNISKYPSVVRNNGGGHFNHSLFWTVLSPNGGQPNGDLLDAINQSFGSLDKMKESFNNAAKTRFGSGWAWLSVAEDQSLIISSTPNQDNPLMDVAEVSGTPILGLDVWEHAYYLKYKNKRPDYVSAFWNVVNWDEVTKRYERVLVG